MSHPAPEVAGVNIYTDPNHPVEVYYGDPLYQDLDSMVRSLGIKIYPEDKVETLPEPQMGIGSQIMVTRATAVNITDAKIKKTYRTWKETIGELLKEKKIELLGQDSVSPNISSKLTYNMNVTITRVAEVEIKEKEVIEFKTIRKNTADLEKGETEIEQKGINGEKEVTYKVKRIDGEEVSREKIDSAIIKESQTEIILIGIGPKLAKSGPHLANINGAAKEYLINGTALMCLMMAESNGNAGSIGYDNDGNPAYYGLFQYSDGFWLQASSSSGYGGASWSNGTAQIYTTAWALAHGQSGRWPPWSRCRDK